MCFLIVGITNSSYMRIIEALPKRKASVIQNISKASSPSHASTLQGAPRFSPRDPRRCDRAINGFLVPLLCNRIYSRRDIQTCAPAPASPHSWLLSSFRFFIAAARPSAKATRSEIGRMLRTSPRSFCCGCFRFRLCQLCSILSSDQLGFGLNLERRLISTCSWQAGCGQIT